jgi:hypothetical protein
MRTLWIAVASLLVACSGAAPRGEAPPEDKKGARAATKHVRGLVQEVYQSIRKGRGNASQTLLAKDVFAIGPVASDLFVDRNGTMLGSASRFDLTGRHRVRSRGLIALASVTAKSTWVIDRVDIDRVRYTLAAVFAEVDDIWYVVAVNLAQVSGGKKADESKSLPGLLDPRAQDVVALVRAGAADPKQFLAQLASHRQVVVSGAGKRDYARGSRSIKRLWRKRKLNKKPMEIVGHPRAGVTPDDRIAWVAANVRADKGPPQRTLWIYQNGKDGWRLVVMQSGSPRNPAKPR